MAHRIFRPDVEHFLCLILFCLLTILGFVFWTYEDGFGRLGSDGGQSDIYDRAIEGFLRDENRFREERDAMFPEFPGPEEDAPDVLKRHRDRQEVAGRKSDRVLNQINREFKSQGKKKKRKKKKRYPKKGELEPLKGGEAFCQIYNTKPNVDEDFECIPIKFKPPVQVLLDHFNLVLVISLIIHPGTIGSFRSCISNPIRFRRIISISY